MLVMRSIRNVRSVQTCGAQALGLGQVNDGCGQHRGLFVWVDQTDIDK